MIISESKSIASKQWRRETMAWEEMVTRLRIPKYTEESQAEFQRMSSDEKFDRKNAAGAFFGGVLNGKRKCNENVLGHTVLTLDADDGARIDDVEIARMLGLRSFKLVAHSTHSHTAETPRLRYIAPLSRQVSNEEYEAIARKVAEYIGINTIDPTCYEPCHAMFWPTCSRDAEYYFKEYEGPDLNPDEILAEYGPDKAWQNVSLWPLNSKESELVRHEVKKQGDPETKPGIVGKWCRTYDVEEAIAEFLSDVYEPCDMPTGKHRYTYSAGSSYGGAVVEDGGKFLYSHHATDPAGGKLCNSFDLVRIHKFGAMDAGKETQEITRRPSYKAMCEFAASDPGFRQHEYQERLEQIEADFADLGEIVEGERRPTDTDCVEPEPGTPLKPALETTEDTSWVEKLTVNHKTGEVDSTIANAELILRNDPKLRGAIAFNRLSNQMVVRKILPWRKKPLDDAETEWRDSDDANLLLYMEKYWHLSAENKIRLAVQVVAEDNAFHPVKEYLDSLAWDGVERLDVMLIRWMNATDDEYTRAVTRKWMCAGVARIYEPGCKADQMIILVGPQGIGKSRLAYELAKGRWHTDSLGALDGKTAYEGLRGKWIVEFAELAATRKSEVESVKNYITKQNDVYRPAYGRNVVTFQRQCIFYGTTNDIEFLRDRTGNRRFWPIEVKGGNDGRLKGFEDEVDQLWAEAKYRYQHGETLWLDTKELKAAALEQQELFTEQDELVGLIENYLDIQLPENWDDLSKETRRDYIQGGTASLAEGVQQRQTVCLMEIRYELLGQNIERLISNNYETRKLADIMSNIPGWKRANKRMNFGVYGTQRGYVRDNT